MYAVYRYVCEKKRNDNVYLLVLKFTIFGYDRDNYTLLTERHRRKHTV